MWNACWIFRALWGMPLQRHDQENMFCTSLHIAPNLLVISRVGAKPDSPISTQRAENITLYIAYFG